MSVAAHTPHYSESRASPERAALFSGLTGRSSRLTAPWPPSHPSSAEHPIRLTPRVVQDRPSPPHQNSRLTRGQKRPRGWVKRSELTHPTEQSPGSGGGRTPQAARAGQPWQEPGPGQSPRARQGREGAARAAEGRCEGAWRARQGSTRRGSKTAQRGAQWAAACGAELPGPGAVSGREHQGPPPHPSPLPPQPTQPIHAGSVLTHHTRYHTSTPEQRRSGSSFTHQPRDPDPPYPRGRQGGTSRGTSPTPKIQNRGFVPGPRPMV